MPGLSGWPAGCWPPLWATRTTAAAAADVHVGLGLGSPEDRKQVEQVEQKSLEPAEGPTAVCDGLCEPVEPSMRAEVVVECVSRRPVFVQRIISLRADAPCRCEHARYSF